MGTDHTSTENTTTPIPKFRFEVDFGTEIKGVAFHEASGMDVERLNIEYRNSNSPHFSTTKMQGMVEYGNVTLKRAVMINNETFINCHNQLIMNTSKRETILIKLVDETGTVKMEWQHNSAWPTKIICTDLKSDDTEIAIDALEISYGQFIKSNNI